MPTADAAPVTATALDDDATSPDRTPVRVSHFWLALVALATGGFAIGTAEFATMGVLPQIAEGVDVSVPQAGAVISAYAVGVVIGAPVLAFFGARLPRRGLLVALMGAFVLGHAASALAGSFQLLLLARVFSGFPHGAYFGVASLVAASMAAPGKKGRAVATVMLGLSVANVVGVPAATWLGQNFGWRSTYWVVTALAALTMLLVMLFVPACPADREASGRRELRAFGTPQIWLTLLVGAIGFGGMFAVLTYVAKTVTTVGGLPEGAVPVFMLIFGVGMVVGTWLAGELARWSVFRSLVIGALGMGAALLGFSAVAPWGWAAAPFAFLITLLGSVLVVNLQLRLMDVAGSAQTLGAAMNHASLNIANALGAWLGGVAIAAGFGYRSTGVVGAVLALAGFLVLVVAARHQRRQDVAAGAPALTQAG